LSLRNTARDLEPFIERSQKLLLDSEIKSSSNLC
jgi:hypothetical protein